MVIIERRFAGEELSSGPTSTHTATLLDGNISFPPGQRSFLPIMLFVPGLLSGRATGANMRHRRGPRPPDRRAWQRHMPAGSITAYGSNSSMNHGTDRYTRAGILCALALLPTIASAQMTRAPQEDPVIRGELGKKLDDYMTRIGAFGMSGTILLARGGEVILHKAYGRADRTSGAPVEIATPFIIGSLSKSFTASAILKLEMQGKLSTADTLGRFFPGLPPEKSGITLHQLLSHTAGFPYLPEDMFARKTRAQTIEEMLALPLESAPGERFGYSSPGYTILAGVIEKASGGSYESYLTKNLFIPAGMTATGFMGDTARWGRATIHSYSGSKDEGRLIDFPATEVMIGAGSIVSTAGDLYRWELALAGTSVLNEEAKKKLFTVHVQPEGQPGYGYGWMIGKTIRGTTLIHHMGGLGGYNAEYRRYIDEGMVMIFTSNARVNGAGYRQAIMNNLSLMIAGREIPMPPALTNLPAGALEKFAGDYTTPSGGALAVWIENGKPMIAAGDQAGISALTGAAPKDSAAQKFLTGRAVAIVTATGDGNFEPLRGSLHPSLPLDDVKKEIAGTWDAYRDSLGALRSVDPVGTAMLAPMVAQSYYRLRFERGDVIGMYAWTGGKVTAMELGLPGAAAMELAPENGNTLASFDVFTGRGIEAGFAVTKSGRPSELAITSPAGKIVARRRG